MVRFNYNLRTTSNEYWLMACFENAAKLLATNTTNMKHSTAAETAARHCLVMADKFAEKL